MPVRDDSPPPDVGCSVEELMGVPLSGSSPFASVSISKGFMLSLSSLLESASDMMFLLFRCT